VIAFDIAASVPAGATINSVTLQLHSLACPNTTLAFTVAPPDPGELGRGHVERGQNEGQGAPSTTNDATWIHRFYPARCGPSPGGDFNATPSASIAVTGNGTVHVESAAMTLDAQGWLDTPGTNFGWLIQGDESVVETAKRFDSRENGQTASRPSLLVDYTLGAGTGACCLPTGDCIVVSPPSAPRRAAPTRATARAAHPIRAASP
jgi:hypothetical protein